MSCPCSVIAWFRNIMVELMKFIPLSNFEIKMVSIAIVLFLSTPVSMADSYLDALDAEAESSHSVEGVSSEGVKLNVDEKLKADEKNDKKLVFEKTLRNSLPTTFKSYRMLSEEDKQQVVDVYYESDLSMPTATKLLFNLYFKK